MKVHAHIRPRRWQQVALEIWKRDFRGIAQVVTGGGKTVFAYLCMGEFLSQHSDGTVFILVPTVALMDQWAVDITEATDVKEAEIATFSGGARGSKIRKINLLVINTARTRLATLLDGSPSMLIVDECHRAGSPINRFTLAGEHCATLGLSATPDREHDLGLEKSLIPSLGDIIFSYDYAEARRDGVIVDFDLINVDVTLDDSEIAQIQKVSEHIDTQLNLARKFDLKPKKLREIEADLVDRVSQATRAAWAAKLCTMHKGEKVLIFHERIAALGVIQSTLCDLGFTAVVYHSKLSKSHRRDNLRLFRRGEIDCLVTCRALDEGANVPEATVGIIARSTRSTRQRIQRLGRVLRPASGKRGANIYTLYASEEERSRLVGEEKDLEGVANVSWRRSRFQ